jgi:hypothetical protein
MPFNDKGEFIRSDSPPAPRATPSRSATGQRRAASSGSGRVTASTGRCQRQRSHRNDSNSDPWEVVGGILVILLGLAALAVVIWLLVAFREWIVFGLALWMISAIRNLFS